MVHVIQVGYVEHQGLKFRNEKGKTSLALNITINVFHGIKASMQSTKANLNLSLCTVAISILESLTIQKD